MLKFQKVSLLKKLVAITVLGLMIAACSRINSGVSSQNLSSNELTSKTLTEYVKGHWIQFDSIKPLNSQQWRVVDAYANFTAAALSVYSLRTTAPLITVVSSQSKVISMFTKDLNLGINPEALYNKVTVESVDIHGCRASLVLELYYPHNRKLHYISSWVKPFDRSLINRSEHNLNSKSSSSRLNISSNQYGPWLFVGYNKVGGVDTPCGI